MKKLKIDAFIQLFSSRSGRANRRYLQQKISLDEVSRLEEEYQDITPQVLKMYVNTLSLKDTADHFNLTLDQATGLILIQLNREAPPQLQVYVSPDMIYRTRQRLVNVD